MTEPTNKLVLSEKALAKAQRLLCISIGTWFVGLVIFSLLWGPIMRPWVQERKGVANLAQARYENLIRAETANAERDAAVLRAQAIGIVGKVAKAYPEYRNQEFVAGFAAALDAGNINQTFYIPTKNGVPMLPSMAGVTTETEN